MGVCVLSVGDFSEIAGSTHAVENNSRITASSNSQRSLVAENRTSDFGDIADNGDAHTAMLRFAKPSRRS